MEAERKKKSFKLKTLDNKQQLLGVRVENFYFSSLLILLNFQRSIYVPETLKWCNK